MTKLVTIAEKILHDTGYANTFNAEGIGSVWKKGNTVIDITVHEGHSNALISIDSYITIRVNREPYILHTPKEVKELFATL